MPSVWQVPITVALICKTCYTDQLYIDHILTTFSSGQINSVGHDPLTLVKSAAQPAQIAM